MTNKQNSLYHTTDNEIIKIKQEADKYEDAEEVVYSGELYLLRKVFEMASDFENAKNWPEFAELNPDTEDRLIRAVRALEIWYSEGDA